MFLIALPLIIVIIIFYILYETYYLKITYHTLTKENTCTIIQLSDIHGRVRYLNGSLSEKVNKLKPDILVITGDLATKREQLNRVYDELAKIECSTIIFVLGNYEREFKSQLNKKLYTSQETADIIDSLQQLGITVLINDFIEYEHQGRKFILYGFDNSIYGNERLPTDVNFDHYDRIILLAHSPRISTWIEEHQLPYHILLTGHTHGGQIRLFNKTIGSYKDWHVGMKEHQGKYFYIHRGLGIVKLPIRLFCRPEIAVFEV